MLGEVFPKQVCVNGGDLGGPGHGSFQKERHQEVCHNWPPDQSRGLEMATSWDSYCRRASCVKSRPSSHPDNHFLFPLLPSALLR